MLDFLRDKRLQMADRVAESLFNGLSVAQSHIEEVAQRCEIMKDIEELAADDINEFYALETATPEEKEKTDGK